MSAQRPHPRALLVLPAGIALVVGIDAVLVPALGAGLLAADRRSTEGADA